MFTRNVADQAGSAVSSSRTQITDVGVANMDNAAGRIFHRRGAAVSAVRFLHLTGTFQAHTDLEVSGDVRAVVMRVHGDVSVLTAAPFMER